MYVLIARRCVRSKVILHGGNGWLADLWYGWPRVHWVEMKPNTFHWRIPVDYASVRCKGLDPDLDFGLG